ncbi:GcrA family cell cycle regulator [Brevundimonas sp. NIBR11]|uniref:GcrA family cell cycle regulator n=1 Tax=Brevundimonas sp. NIBR11 TaxID=3015999 RepID=UPI0022F02D0A|nr:GcrA family cell cycle regulator [Brevundimonas sp. NIBR11]
MTIVHWTKDMDDVLDEQWALLTPSEAIAAMIGVSPDQLRYRARRRELAKRPAGKPKVDPESTWGDPAKVAELSKMWIAGLSASTIGAKLKVGRAAVIGKVHRLGLSRVGREPASAPSRLPKAPIVARDRHVGRTGDRFKPKAPKPADQSPFAGRATSPSEAAKKRADAQMAGLQSILQAAEPANDDAIPLINRRAFQCSWPVGEPDRRAEQLCCGQPVIGERTKSTQTYCDRHRQRAAPNGIPIARDLIRSVRRAA